MRNRRCFKNFFVFFRQFSGASAASKRRVTRLGFQQSDSEIVPEIRPSEGVFVLGPHDMFKTNGTSVERLDPDKSAYVWIPGYFKPVPATSRRGNGDTNIFKNMQSVLSKSPLDRFSLCVGK